MGPTAYVNLSYRFTSLQVEYSLIWLNFWNKKSMYLYIIYAINNVLRYGVYCSSITKHGEYLFHVDFKRSSWLTLRTGAWLDLFVLSLVEWAEDEATFHTVVLDNTELRHYTGAAGDDAARTYQLIHMQLPGNNDRTLHQHNECKPTSPTYLSYMT